MMYAVIRVRGKVNINTNLKKTFEYLNLRRANNLSLWQENEQIFRMLKKVESYATFGKINDATLKTLLEKKAEGLEEGAKVDAKKVFDELKKGKTLNQAGVFNCFRMSPPRKGFERGGIKKPYKSGGALGDRKEEISEIIERMM